jgi:phosphodiesterase/alkaline phosphatase D-like protein
MQNVTKLQANPGRRGIAMLFWLMLLILQITKGYSQPYDPGLRPFYHGVASGDPMSDRVIIWTRVTPESLGAVSVSWKMATDIAMQQVVKSGVFVTDASRDYTVKIDVTGLNPGRTYYYQFTTAGKNSLIGRTRTTPVGDVENLRFAVVSCNNFEGGYFNAFGRIADRTDLDAVIHLGDYIYEQAEGQYGAKSLIDSKERTVLPKNEIISLDDYRKRYATYRLDPDLRRAHQQHPFITVWDDHESANDSFKDGAENHDPATEGPWEERKETSRRVYEEWMPIRGNADPIYRTKRFGDLVDLIMIDTRIEGRDEQINDVTNPALYAPGRTLLGTTQREWLFNELKTSKARWKVIGNQVIFSEFNVGWAAAAAPNLGTPEQLESIFLDIWDGYPAERQRVIDFISGNNIDNVVILTGDFHSSFAFDVAPNPTVFSIPGKLPAYNPATGAGSVAVEFATPSISSANFDENLDAGTSAAFEFQFNKPLPAQAGPFAGINPNPHMKYTDLDRHGYFILDLKKDRAQADWYFVETILKPSAKEAFDAGFYTLDGENHLQKAAAASPANPAASAPAPGIPTTRGTASGLDIELLGTYATGVFDEGAAEIAAYDAATERLFVINAAGTVDVLDISNPGYPTKLLEIPVKTLTGGTPNSVAARNGLVAIAIELVEEGTDTQLPGRVAFLPADITAAPTQLDYLVTVGALPDMLTFTPDGKTVLIANEGEPSDAFDPEGSVSVIDISSGPASAKVRTATFEAFNGQEDLLRSKGVRIFPDKKASEDFEPEFIAISPDSSVAFVALQEANAFAVLDIANAQILDILPLGYKDHSRGQESLQQYNFNEPPIGKKLNGEDILFGGLSGLYFEKAEGNTLTFVTVPDRGPNGDESPAGRPFLKPDYVAEIFRFELDKNTGSITIKERIPLRRQDGNQIKAITGFPNIPGFDEKPIDEAGNALPYDPFGADLEGIVTAPDGSFWMVDEYRPAIYHFSASGMLINRFVPKGTAALAQPPQPAGTYGEETLPAEYARRRTNRGFEAMALDSNKGILYAFIQTPLANPDRAASDASSVIRMLGIDPATGTPVAEYVYLLEKPAYRQTLADKMGDAAYDPKTGKFYVIERDDNAFAYNKKYIFELDLTGATNLLAAGAPALLSGKTLEQHTADELAAAGIRPVHKLKVVNLPSLGYVPSDKPEGLTILPDGSLAVLNDNDFGLAGYATVGLGIIRFDEGNRLDASDRDGAINLQNWPVLGMYMPDGLAAFEANGETYYITANEGDARNEDERAGSDDIVLDEKAFPDASGLKSNENLGRLNISGIDGDLDGDGDYDRLYAYGARSFTIWDKYGNQVFDSSDDLEEITAAIYPEFFNSTNSENNFDNRSDDKGPEPEGVTIGALNGRTYAFVGLERIGGFMVYDVTHPQEAKFIDYINNRNFEGDPQAGTAGDLGPEGLLFIDAAESPVQQPLLVVTNEISGTTSIYGVRKKPEITEFVLVNVLTGKDVATLKDGAEIDLATYPNTVFNIRANTDSTGIGSVVFDLNGKAAYRIENEAPYALFGKLYNNIYIPWLPESGTYTLTATPYAEAGGKGKSGIPNTITFKVINTARIESFTLVDARTGKDIRQLKDGEVLNLKSLSGKKVNIRANTYPQTVGSVVFDFNGKKAFQTESLYPYALFGNLPNNKYYGWKPETGSYTVKATPYSALLGKGSPGTAMELSFKVVDEPVVERFMLVNGDTREEIMEIRNGDILNLAALGITNFNVRVILNPANINGKGKITFSLNGQDSYVTEYNFPYELFGPRGSKSKGWAPLEGSYTVKATVATLTGKQTYTEGETYSVSFEIDNATTADAMARNAAAAGTHQPIRQVNVFPNPVKQNITIDFGEVVEGELSIHVYDIMGRKAYYEDNLYVDKQQRIEINLSALPARNYILKVRAAHLSKSFQIIKE